MNDHSPFITVIVAGVETALTGAAEVRIESLDQWGMAPGHLLESRGSQQNGSSVEDYRLDPRDLELTLSFPGGENLYDRRRRLLSLFQRSLTASALRLYFDDSSVRQIDWFFGKGLSLPRDGRMGNIQRDGLILRCPDPTFYDPAPLSFTPNIGGGSGGFVVPMVVPTAVGSSSADATFDLLYTGTWRSSPYRIRITGPITEFILTNTTTGDVIQAKSGVTISAGDYYDINTGYDIASVTDSLGANQIANIADGDDLTAWHLGADPEAVGGLNQIRIRGTNVTDATALEIDYYVRDLGV